MRGIKRHQKRPATSVSVQHFGEVRIDHFKQADVVYLGHEVGSVSSLANGALNGTGLRPVGAAQNRQLPDAQRAFYDLVIGDHFIEVCAGFATGGTWRLTWIRWVLAAWFRLSWSCGIIRH